MVLPSIGHRDAKLRAAWVIHFAITRNSDKLFQAVALDRRNKCHTAPVVDIHELVDQARRGEFERTEQPEVARALGERIDERDLALAIVRA